MKKITNVTQKGNGEILSILVPLMRLEHIHIIIWKILGNRKTEIQQLFCTDMCVLDGLQINMSDVRVSYGYYIQQTDGVV